VLAVGTRLHQPQVRWGVDVDLKLIRIDIDPTEITRILKPSLGIVADAKAALAALHNALERRNPRRQSRKEELDALKSLYPSRRLSAGRHCRLAGPGRPAGSRPRIPVF
jgi:acetolactate synthase-1/2/3 large subunit